MAFEENLTPTHVTIYLREGQVTRVICIFIFVKCMDSVETALLPVPQPWLMADVNELM